MQSGVSESPGDVRSLWSIGSSECSSLIVHVNSRLVKLQPVGILNLVFLFERFSWFHLLQLAQLLSRYIILTVIIIIITSDTGKSTL